LEYQLDLITDNYSHFENNIYQIKHQNDHRKNLPFSRITMTGIPT